MLMRSGFRRPALLVTAMTAVLLLSACNGIKSTPVNDQSWPEAKLRAREPGGIFGDDGIIFGGKKKVADDSSGIGVNAFLWRSTLDTLSFMPLVSADPFGGVIITDWYQPGASPGERFKATAYILGRQLRSDGFRLAVFRQVMQNGQWVDAPVSPTTVSEIEDRILARARELRAEGPAG
jgi:hypothetical protein